MAEGLGFSSENTLEGNTIVGNHTAGIATENGVGMEVSGNLLEGNSCDYDLHGDVDTVIV